MRRSVIILNLIALTICIDGTLSLSDSVVAPAATHAVSDSSTSNDGGDNMVLQLFGFFKNSVVRTVDGTKEMWGNHGRCNQIRAKQKYHREKLQKQWEFEEQDLTSKELNERLSKVNGGVTYDEFVFLIKGKEDRGKLMNIAFMMWGAPRILPYAMMFYPNLLPGPFAPLQDASSKESKLEKLSRERTHAVIRTLLKIENEARVVPALAKLNIFGKKKQARRMDEMDSLGKTIWQIMSSSETKSNNDGALIAMNTMEDSLYSSNTITRAEQRLVNVPCCITNGILTGIDGSNLLQGIMPQFMKRGQIISHIQKLNDIDNFLVDNKINLDDFSTARLLEACSDRLIGGPGQTDDEMRNYLANWLDLTTYKPTERIEKTGEYFNTNLAKTAMMGYYSVSGARDDRSVSYLPRLMFSARPEID